MNRNRKTVHSTNEALAAKTSYEAGPGKVNKYQMSLSEFKHLFGFKDTVAYELVRSKGFPAHKIKGNWYVDIPAYYEWRAALSQKRVAGGNRHA